MNIDPGAHKDLLKLRESFGSQIHEKLSHLRGLVDVCLTQAAGESQLETATRFVHKLAGGSASFGMPHLAGAAAELEEFLDSIQRRAGETPLLHAEEIKRMLTQVESAADRDAARSAEEWLQDYLSE